MHTAVPLACFLSIIRPPGIQYENSILQIAPVDKSKCPYIKQGNDVAFQLYTRHNPTVYQELAIGDDEKLFASNMDFHDKTMLYFHAWMEQPEDGSGVMVREAYMQRGDTNVIMVDARHLEAGPWYFTAAQNTWYIGRYAAQFIDYLASRGLNLNNTHLVGHSLGAQAAGVAGSSLKSGRVARITGLDPALPLFDHLPLLQRLDPGDADFVDIIHTDAGIFGYKAPMGHADFYPNGGISPQPGCELEVVIPKQLLLNKCDKHTHTQGHYIYFLTDHIFKKVKLHTQTDKQKINKVMNSNNARIKRALSNIVDAKLSNESQTVTKDDIANSTATGDKVERIIEIIPAKDSKDVDAKPTDSNKINTSENARLNREAVYDNSNGTIIDLAKESKDDKRNTDNNAKTTDLYKKIEDTSAKKNKKAKPNNPQAKTIQPIQLNIIRPNIIPRLLLNTIRNRNRAKNSKKVQKRPQFFGQNILKSIPMPKIFQITPKMFKTSTAKPKKITLLSRQKRFLPFLQKDDGDSNIIFKLLDFLVKNRKNVLPVLTVMREINTIVKSANGELNHFSKESNNYIGVTPPVFTPVTYTLELGNEGRLVAFMKKLLGLTPKGDRLTIGG